MSDPFKALVVDEVEGKPENQWRELTLDDLPAGDVVVDVAYSTLNYKDGLALNGNRGKVMRSFPMVPGIDLAGTVESSDAAGFKAGDRVAITGWGLSETEWGGYTQEDLVKAGHLVKIPGAISLQQAMAIGTAGFTSMMCVMALEHMDITPDAGEILVTGAAGGVGSVAVAILARLGYTVAAVSGRPETRDYLSGLGAASFIDRAEFEGEAKPLARPRWPAAVDTVGGTILANLIPQIEQWGAVAVCGNAAGFGLETTVLPLILRGVSLMGINSVFVPQEKRAEIWRRLASDLPLELLDGMTEVVPFEEVLALSGQILKGQVRGRTVIDVNA